jgi:hypothetical protein
MAMPFGSMLVTAMALRPLTRHDLPHMLASIIQSRIPYSGFGLERFLIQMKEKATSWSEAFDSGRYEKARIDAGITTNRFGVRL